MLQLFDSTDLHSECTQHERQVPQNPPESPIKYTFPKQYKIMNWNFFLKNKTHKNKKKTTYNNNTTYNNPHTTNKPHKGLRLS